MDRNPELNPYICEIAGDLSRADVVVLTLLSRGKRVVEFGIGGSTIILNKITKFLVTYEHSETWVERVPVNTEVKVIPLDSNLKGEGFEADVLFVDGHSRLRDKALMEFWPYVKTAILHDTRLTYAANILRKFFEDPENYKWLESIEWNYLESNMCVMKKREYPLVHEDWKQTEAGNNRVGYGR